MKYSKAGLTRKKARRVGGNGMSPTEGFNSEKSEESRQPVFGVFRIPPFKVSGRQSGFFMDVIVNIVPSIIVFIWGIFFFSNSYFQMSIFMRIRNAFESPSKNEAEFRDIRNLGIDIQSRLFLAEHHAPRTGDNGEVLPTNSDIEGTVYALEILAAYARQNSGLHIVTGVDYFVENYENNRGSVDALTGVLASLPSNLDVVLGSVLYSSPGGFHSLRADITRKILGKINTLRAQAPRSSRFGRILSGVIHYSEASVANGTSDPTGSPRAAVGYYPLIHREDTDFVSLPLLMLMLGEVDPANTAKLVWAEDGGVVLPDFNDPSLFWQRLSAISGIKPSDLLSFQYYNVRSSSDVAMRSSHSVWLSDLDERMKHGDFWESSGEPYEPIDNFETGKSLWQKYWDDVPVSNRQSASTSVEYVFVSQSASPSFASENGDKGDLVLTLTSPTNPATFDEEESMGVGVHMTALSNLRNRDYVRDLPTAGVVTVYVATAILLIFSTMRRTLAKTLVSFAFSGFVLFIVGIGFFVFGWFIALAGLYGWFLIGFAVLCLLRILKSDGQTSVKGATK